MLAPRADGQEWLALLPFLAQGSTQDERKLPFNCVDGFENIILKRMSTL